MSKERHSKWGGYFDRWGFFLPFLLASIPVIRLWVVLNTSGENCPLRDDIFFIPLIDGILSGNYHWKNLFSDTFQSFGHLNLFPGLFLTIFSYLTHWNVFAVLNFGIFLNLLFLILIFDAITFSIKNFKKFWLIPMFSWLIFSSSQLGAFDFDLAILQMGFLRFGIGLGIWGLVRLRGTWRSIFLMSIGGILASWSWGSGPLIWPCFVGGMVCLFPREFKKILILCLAGILGIAPYIYFLILHPRGENVPLSLSPSMINFSYYARAVLWPFIDDYFHPLPQMVALFGIFFLVGFLFFYFKKRSDFSFRRNAMPGLILLVFSLLQMGLLGAFRGILFPWYTFLFMFFWIGLLSLASAIFVSYESGKILPWLSAFFLIFLITMLGYSNLDWRNKLYFSTWRSPVAASCLRNYKTSPTYCEDLALGWPAGEISALTDELKFFNLFPEMEKLGQPLERHQLSVFAPRQIWSLQGDFFLDNVEIFEDPAVFDVFWSPNLSASKVPVTNFRHLNLFLHTPNEISWKVSLPENLKKAIFYTAAAISDSAPTSPVADGVIFRIEVVSDFSKKKKVYKRYLPSKTRHWVPISIPLMEFSGNTITIHLTSEMVRNGLHDWAMYRYPYIELELGKTNKNIGAITLTPSNTDLNPDFPKISTEDLQLLEKFPGSWTLKNIEVVRAPRGEKFLLKLMNNPSMDLKEKLNVCTADFSHILFRLRAPKHDFPGFLKIVLEFDETGKYPKFVKVPLLNDGEEHSYSYDLKLLELDKNEHLRMIRIEPTILKTKSPDTEVGFLDLRLIRKNNSDTSVCNNYLSN